MDKEKIYKELLPSIKSLLENESDLIANLGNVCAALHYPFNFHWTGFYLVKNNELVLGPFQGPIACTRIGFNKGVCGSSWKERRTFVVPDVNKFEGHIACSPFSKSEIVIPLIANDKVWGVLDIDSSDYNTFDDIDLKYLSAVCNLLVEP